VESDKDGDGLINEAEFEATLEEAEDNNDTTEEIAINYTEEEIAPIDEDNNDTTEEIATIDKDKDATELTVSKLT